jgi:DNA (cytosine-5)-methyltransferase 1
VKAISLYTGAGGLDLGFEAAGIETAVAVENDPDAVATLLVNRTWPVVADSIHSEAAVSARLLALAGLQVGEADVLIGGPPCQPFSKSGYWLTGDSLRLADPRADTLGAYLRVLRDTQPRAFLIENVAGLAYSDKDEGLLFVQRAIDQINSELRTDYSFSVKVLSAVEFGVPQDRERVFVIGSRDGTQFIFPKPTHNTLPTGERTSLEPCLTTWDAIGDLQDDDDPDLRMSGKWADLLPSIPEGRNYLHHTDRGDGLPIFGWRRRYWSFLLKLAKRLPSWTITADPGPAIGPFHWRNRRLSTQELLRLQTFPAGYRVVGGRRAAQRQLGNAVPSALAEKLALAIRHQLLRDDDFDVGRMTLIPVRRADMPEEDPVSEVPVEYSALVGQHSPHPGEGLGPGAMRRETAMQGARGSRAQN